MILDIKTSENKKTIYYQSDIICNCTIKVIENGEAILINEIYLEPNILYYTTWITNWYDKKIVFEYYDDIQTYNIEGANKLYDIEKIGHHIEEEFLNERTELCEIMSKNGSDKSERPSHGNLSGHNYTKFYYKLFSEIRNDELNFFELGMGTNNPNIESNMSVDGLPGASLVGWSEFFKNSKIYGADIDTDILFNTDKIKTFFCDQTNPQIIKQLWDQKQLDFDFDVIIEDGLHEFGANKTFLENSFHKLRKGGYFIIEDININETYNWCKYFEYFSKEFGSSDIKFIKLHCDHNSHDNNLILIRKK